ncbi:MAG: histidine phosphatase family protein [Gammaproteobacteria bacterium]|nr:histidine phosphatase family protein [Gammaproteobacteria bacterium]
MKTLFLLRHGKSSWSNSQLKDFERPLADRGLSDIQLMASRFVDSGRQVQCIIASPAVRAKSTAILFAKEIGFPQDEVAANPELYFAGATMFLKAAGLVDEEFESAMLVGHNPAITDVVNDMCGAAIDNIPTSGLVELRLPIEHWSDIAYDNAELIDFDYPKRHQEND